MFDLQIFMIHIYSKIVLLIDLMNDCFFDQTIPM